MSTAYKIFLEIAKVTKTGKLRHIDTKCTSPVTFVAEFPTLKEAERRVAQIVKAQE